MSGVPFGLARNIARRTSGQAISDVEALNVGPIEGATNPGDLQAGATAGPRMLFRGSDGRLIIVGTVGDSVTIYGTGGLQVGDLCAQAFPVNFGGFTAGQDSAGVFLCFDPLERRFAVQGMDVSLSQTSSSQKRSILGYETVSGQIGLDV